MFWNEISKRRCLCLIIIRDSWHHADLYDERDGSVLRFFGKLEVHCLRLSRTYGYILKYGEDYGFIDQGSYVLSIGCEVQRRVGGLVFYTGTVDYIEFELLKSQPPSPHLSSSIWHGKDPLERFMISSNHQPRSFHTTAQKRCCPYSFQKMPMRGRKLSYFINWCAIPHGQQGTCFSIPAPGELQTRFVYRKHRFLVSTGNYFSIRPALLGLSGPLLMAQMWNSPLHPGARMLLFGAYSSFCWKGRRGVRGSLQKAWRYCTDVRRSSLPSVS